MSVLGAVRNMIVRGAIKSLDAAQGVGVALVQTLADEEDDAEVFQEYGLASAVPAGASCVVVKINGSDDHPIVIATESRGDRPTDLEAGEVALYSTHGQRVLLKDDGNVYVTPAEGKNVITGTETEAEAKAVAIAEEVKARLLDITVLLCTWTVAANDGGLALQSAAKVLWGVVGTTVEDVDADNTKAKVT